MPDPADWRPEPDECPVCGADAEWVDCDHGCDDGFFDEADDDPVNYAPGVEVYPCPVCKGNGGWWECTRLPHPPELVKAYRDRFVGEGGADRA